jgi:hypothetical protein
MTVDTLGRAVGLYRRTAASRSATVLLLANAIPLVGVLFFGWSLLTILVLYWVENGIIGFWNVPKLALAQGSAIPRETLERRLAEMDALPADARPERQLARDRLAAMTRLGRSSVPGVGRVGLAIFFSIHYGMFWLVHGFFVFALPAFGGIGSGTAPCFDGTPPGGELPPGFFPGLEPCEGSAFGEVLWGSVALAAVALFISHGASFLFNYLGRGEYLTTSPMRQMGAPYARVVVLHLTIIFGAFVVAFLGSPIGALLVLVVLKTAFDLGLHLREHRASGPQAPATSAATPGGPSAVEPAHPE